MPKKNTSDVIDEHVHAWFQTGVIGEERCKCKKVRISASEEERRISEWASYYELVRTTEAYSDFKEMSKAFAAKDLDWIKQIDARVMSRNHETLNEWGDKVTEPNDPESLLPKPNFPDPTTWKGYVIA